MIVIGLSVMQALRHHEGDEAKVCFFIVQMLLSKSNEFRMRVQDFLAENSPEHWRNEEWFTRHSTFHQVHPSPLREVMFVGYFCI